MRNSFDYYKKVEKPNMYLCNPDRTPIGFVNSENRHLILRFNDLSELTFTVPKITETRSVYDRIETKRLLFIEKIGWFQITNVVETTNGEHEAKEVTAESHQTQLKSRGFITEERVYMFYNPNDPLDENYDSQNAGAIPSVVGQLYQQLGIKINLQIGDIEPTNDDEDWTLIYIDPALKFEAKSYDKQYEAVDGADNLCRSFKENETYGYDFIMNDVESAFEVVFEFDFLYHAIKVKRLEDITKATNIYLSLDNVLESMSVTENAENIVTVLSCNGNDLDIRTVNPMGTNYIVNFDYYKKEVSDDGKIKYPWMSETLVKALNDWKDEWEKWQKDDASRTNHTEGYSTLVERIQNLYVQQANIESDIQYANLKLTDLQQARDLQLKQDAKADNGKGIIAVEDVAAEKKSLSPQSSYKASAFTENSPITAYLETPTISSEPEQYTFSFSGGGKTGTAKSMLENFIGGEKTSDGYYKESDDSQAYLYFTDDASGKSYCKILIAAEVGVVKDENGNIGENGSAEVRGVTFNVTSATDKFSITLPDGTSKTVSKSNSHFIYNGTRYKIVESADKITTIYCYYVAGFRRFTSYKQLTGDGNWCNIWEQYVKTIDGKKSELDSQISAIEEKMAYISEQCHIQKYIKRRGSALYNEFSNYWVEGEYSNDNLAATDTTTIAERIELAKELMEAGEKELSKVSQPTFELSVSAVNFIKLIEFRAFTDELELGRVITIEKDENTHYRPALVSIEYDLDLSDSFSLTFSTAAKLDETAMTFADLLNKSSSTSRTISANWSNLTDYWKNKDKITSLLASPLDRTLRAAQANMSNQEFTIDTTGILGRKWSDDSHTSFEKEQVRMMNNTIMFTDDNWETIRTALGKVSYDENGEAKQAYGLIAEVLVGSLLLGEQLNIRDKDSSILLNKNGIFINNGEENVFKASTDGNVFVKGKIEATSGAFGQLRIDEKGAISAEYFSVTADGEIKATKGTIGALTVDENGSIFTPNGNFTLSENGLLSAKGANIEGHITATSGNIGAFEITNDGLESAHIRLNSQLIYFPTQSVFNLSNDVTIFNDENVSYIATSGQRDFEVRNIGGAGIRFKANEESQNITLSVTINNFSVINGGAVDLDGDTSMIHQTAVDFNYSLSNNAVLMQPYTITFYLRVKLQESNIVMQWQDKETKDFTIQITIPAGQTSGSFSQNLSILTNLRRYVFVGVAKEQNATSLLNSLSYSVVNINKTNNILYSLGSFCPNTTATSSSGYLLGDDNHVWRSIRAYTASITTSDVREKNSIRSLSSNYETFFDNLIPNTFKYNHADSGRIHLGYIAQDVEQALLKAGLSSMEFAGLCIGSDENKTYGLRYEEFIALNTSEIQKLKRRVKELEDTIKELQGD